MEYRFLGNTGLKISALSLGSWVTFGEQIDLDRSYEIMKAAFDHGINFFDNAEAYAEGNAEIVMGKIIKKAGWKRTDLVLSTKIFWGGKGVNDVGLSRKHIIEGTKASLKRLQTDYVDLIFCHRPDLYTPIEETVRAMNYIIDSGMAFYWGTSEWSAEQIRHAYEIARREHLIPPVMEQPQYNMLHREKMEKEFLPLFRDFKPGTTVWSPLASGFLSGKYNNGIPERSRMSMEEYKWLWERYKNIEWKDRSKKLSDLALKLGISQAQLAIAWILKNPNVSTVITGASKVEQVHQNIKSLEAVKLLTEEVMQEIENILQNKPEPEPDLREE